MNKTGYSVPGNKRPFGFLGSLCLAILFACSAWVGGLAAPPTPEPEPQPIETDRLALPTLPPNPTAIELGNYSYYYNCMPCHGDQGQGLTDEWRMVWVEDHRNCWDRGCHAGRPKDEGFPIPRYVPGVTALERFADAQALFEYLKATHPPQHPGNLADEEYGSLTAFLWDKAGRSTPGQTMAGTDNPPFDIHTTWLALAALGVVVLGLPRLLTWQGDLKIRSSTSLRS